jgi:cytochrome b561
MIKRLSVLLLLILPNLAAHAAPPDWTIASQSSHIEFTGTHAGQAFTGRFQNWSGTIAFDASALDQSQIVIDIDMSSAKTGDNYKDGTLPQEEWLDVKHFPKARFEARSFKVLGPEKFEAQGSLTIKGKTTPLDLPFTLKIEGLTAVMTASAKLDRIALGIGTKSDPDAEWVSRDIKVDISVTARRN